MTRPSGAADAPARSPRTRAARRVAIPALALALLGATATGCEAEALDTLMLDVTSDAPLGGGSLDTLQVLLFDGLARHPDDLADTRVDLAAQGLDPVAGGVVVQLDYAGGPLFSDPDVRLQITGWSGGALASVHESTIRLTADVLVDVHLTAVAAGCDPDGDGFLDCDAAGCCEPGAVLLADCDSTDGELHPWASEPACRTCADRDGDGASDCVETRAGCDPDDAADPCPGG